MSRSRGLVQLTGLILTSIAAVRWNTISSRAEQHAGVWLKRKASDWIVDVVQVVQRPDILNHSAGRGVEDVEFASGSGGGGCIQREGICARGEEQHPNAHNIKRRIFMADSFKSRHWSTAWAASAMMRLGSLRLSSIPADLLLCFGRWKEVSDALAMSFVAEYVLRASADCRAVVRCREEAGCRWRRQIDQML